MGALACYVADTRHHVNKKRYRETCANFLRIPFPQWQRIGYRAAIQRITTVLHTAYIITIIADTIHTYSIT